MALPECLESRAHPGKEARGGELTQRELVRFKGPPKGWWLGGEVQNDEEKGEGGTPGSQETKTELLGKEEPSGKKVTTG